MTALMLILLVVSHGALFSAGWWLAERTWQRNQRLLNEALRRLGEAWLERERARASGRPDKGASL